MIISNPWLRSLWQIFRGRAVKMANEGPIQPELIPSFAPNNPTSSVAFWPGKERRLATRGNLLKPEPASWGL